MRRSSAGPSPSGTIRVQIDDLDATLVKAVGAGAAVALPKAPIPGVGWLAYIHDTEGNILGRTQPEPSAK